MADNWKRYLKALGVVIAALTVFGASARIRVIQQQTQAQTGQVRDLTGQVNNFIKYVEQRERFEDMEFTLVREKLQDIEHHMDRLERDADRRRQ